MRLFALELVALILLFAADEAVNHREGWSAGYQVLVALSIAVVLATLLQMLARAGII